MCVCGSEELWIQLKVIMGLFDYCHEEGVQSNTTQEKHSLAAKIKVL